VVVDRPPIGQQVLLDARGSESEIANLVALAGGLARPDGGVVIPFGVVGATQQPDVRRAVERASAEAAAIGLDGDGMVRVGDSFTSATVNLVAELGASLVVLAWDGPKWAADYVFGNDIDGVGEASPVPTIAAHLVRPWTRIVVQLGNPSTVWQRADVELTADVVRHLRRASDLPLVVLFNDADLAGQLFATDSGHEIKIVDDSDEQSRILDAVLPTDLVVAPAHVVHDMPPWRARRLVRRLQDTNVAIVGGPHRLTISRGVTTRPLSTAVGPRIDLP
jgi:hypothetical protein